MVDELFSLNVEDESHERLQNEVSVPEIGIIVRLLGGLRRLVCSYGY